jgi:hypothetical protein
VGKDLANLFKLSAEDGRAFRRFAVEVPASVWPLDHISHDPEQDGHGNSCVSVVIKDFSISGMSFLSREALPIQRTILVMFRLGVQSFPVHASVRRCIPDRIDLGKHLVGVQFLNTPKTTATLPAVIAYIRSLYERPG